VARKCRRVFYKSKSKLLNFENICNIIHLILNRGGIRMENKKNNKIKKGKEENNIEQTKI